MQLFKQLKNSLVSVSEQPFLLEKDIQTIVEANIYDLFGYSFVSSEFSVSNYRLDTLCFDEENNSFVIIEYKKGSSYSVIDQGYSYLSTMLNNKAEFILEYNEKSESSLKRDEVNWSNSKVLFISPSFNSYQKNSVNFKDVPFELWEIRRFEGDLISLELHKASSKESIESISADSVIKSVSKEVKSYSEDDVMHKTNDETKNRWLQLKEMLLTADHTEMVVGKNYIKYTKLGKGVCYFNFRKSYFRVDIIRGNKKQDGSKSKNFFVIDDPKGLAEEKHHTWKSGDEGHQYKFAVRNNTSIDYVEMLIKQKYKSM